MVFGLKAGYTAGECRSGSWPFPKGGGEMSIDVADLAMISLTVVAVTISFMLLVTTMINKK
jgi:hypothetical protein